MMGGTHEIKVNTGTFIFISYVEAWSIKYFCSWENITEQHATFIKI